MTLRLVCDHCNNVIEESEFKEVRHAEMTRNPRDPLAGMGRQSEETTHYHTLCYEARTRAADAAALTAAGPEPALPSDHPLARLEEEAIERQAELIRTQREQDPVVEPVVGSASDDA